MINFLIRIRGNAKEIVGLYPLLFTILKQNQQNKINIIVDEEYDHNQLCLPRGVRTYQIPKSKVDGVFGVHHFAANLHDVFNVDYFIDYICDFHSAFIGLAFKAKKRIGLSGGPKSYFYTHTMESFSGLFDDEKYLSVRKYIPEIENLEIFEIKSEPVKEYNICLFDLEKFSDEKYLKRISSLFEIFDLPKFFYVPEHLENLYHEETAEILGMIRASGQVFSEKFEELSNKIDTFEIIFTDNYLFAIFCHMQNRRVLFMCDESFSIPNCRYIDLSTFILEFNDTELCRYGINELKDIRIPSEIYDYLLNYYTLRIEPT